MEHIAGGVNGSSAVSGEGNWVCKSVKEKDKEEYEIREKLKELKTKIEEILHKNYPDYLDTTTSFGSGLFTAGMMASLEYNKMVGGLDLERLFGFSLVDKGRELATQLEDFLALIRNQRATIKKYAPEEYERAIEEEAN